MSAPSSSVVAEHQHAAYRRAARELVVESIHLVAPLVRHLVLAPRDGGPLTPYEPGSHVVVETPTGRNAYSLTGDGASPHRYTISVLRRGDGGGSAWIHDVVAVGDVLTVEGPRSAFPPRHDQRHALLVAGGIGITPVLSHARAVVRWGGTAEVVYVHRPGVAPHLDEVDALTEHGVRVHVAVGRDAGRALLAERLADQPLGTHAYACGPASMLAAYLELGAEAGWPASRLHLERFEGLELDPGVPFEVTVSSTRARVTVPAGTSLLQALLDHGTAVPHLCRQGFCGECRVGVVRAARLEHRDEVLSEHERAAGDTILCCVSRGTDLEVAL